MANSWSSTTTQTSPWARRITPGANGETPWTRSTGSVTGSPTGLGGLTGSPTPKKDPLSPTITFNANQDGDKWNVMDYQYDPQSGGFKKKVTLSGPGGWNNKEVWQTVDQGSVPEEYIDALRGRAPAPGGKTPYSWNASGTALPSIDDLGLQGVSYQNEMLPALMKLVQQSPTAQASGNIQSAGNYADQAAQIFNQMLGIGNDAREIGQKYGDQSARIAQGELDPRYMAAFEKAISGATDRTVGSTMANMANRGIVNSSVTSNNMADIARGVQEASARHFLDSLNTSLGAIGNAYGQEMGGASGQMSAYQNAGQGMLGSGSLHSNLAQQQQNAHNSQVSNMLQAMQAANMPFQTQVGNVRSLYDLGDSQMDPAKQLYQLWFGGRHGLKSEPIVTQEPGFLDYMIPLIGLFA